MKNKSVNMNAVCVMALSVLGGAIAYAPKQGEQNSVLAILVALILGFPIYSLLSFFISKINIGIKPLKMVTGAVLSLALLYFSADSVSSVTDYFSNRVLPKTPTAIIGAVMAVLLIAATILGGDVIKKTAFVTFFAVMATIFLLLFVSLPDIKLSTIKIADFDAAFFKTVLKYAVIIFVFSVGGIIFLKKGKKKIPLKSYTTGALIGGALLSLAILNTVLILGEAYSKKLAFPYPTAVSTFSAGTLFARLDGFVYFIIFSAGFIKSAVCLSAIEKLLAPFEIKNRRLLLSIVSLFSVLLSFAL